MSNDSSIRNRIEHAKSLEVPLNVQQLEEFRNTMNRVLGQFVLFKQKHDPEIEIEVLDNAGTFFAKTNPRATFTIFEYVRGEQNRGTNQQKLKRIETTRGWLMKDVVVRPSASENRDIEDADLVLAIDGRNWVNPFVAYGASTPTLGVMHEDNYIESQKHMFLDNERYTELNRSCILTSAVRLEKYLENN